jgi:hypothetical protein
MLKKMSVGTAGKELANIGLDGKLTHGAQTGQS